MKKDNHLLNYTTKIEASKTISEIQENLVRHGATSIMTNYTDNGLIESLSFVIKTIDGQNIGIKLPCNAKPVLGVLENQKIPRSYQNEEQALRVAWRIIKTWVEGQMALLETQMVKMEQIFLPYALNKDGITLYESISSNKFALLSDNPEEGKIIN
jgi:hypothetical protein